MDKLDKALEEMKTPSSNPESSAPTGAARGSSLDIRA